MLERARNDGLGAVYLLTTTAADFFADLGFEPVDREAVPEPIRQSAAFADLCPSTATCMRRDLE
ncbi:MAG: hypothetical protein ACOCZD_02725 [Haloferacaceae archaeon]